MKRYLRTGIKLSSETREAWELAGFQVVRPSYMDGPPGLVVNYGSPTPMLGAPQVLLNYPALVHRTRVEELPKYIGEYMPIVKLDQDVIVKTNGSKGRGKLVVAEGSPVIVQRFLYPAREFRIITWDIPGVMEPEVLAWSEKVCDDPLDPATCKEFVYLPTYELPDRVRSSLLVCHDRLGLNFVGWDVLLHKNMYWIIEANSAPGIGEQTARRLRKRLRRVFAPALAA